LIVVHGVDLVDVEDVRRLLASDGSDVLASWLTARETAELEGDPRLAERVSSRVAIKEAVAKALGTGLGDGVGFLDVEVSTSAVGAPSVSLTAGAELRAREVGVVRWVVSSSHEADMAMGSAIGLGADRVVATED
jgi:holo-[acyl-carrier protein] synthase